MLFGPFVEMLGPLPRLSRPRDPLGRVGAQREAEGVVPGKDTTRRGQLAGGDRQDLGHGGGGGSQAWDHLT